MFNLRAYLAVVISTARYHCRVHSMHSKIGELSELLHQVNMMA